MIQNIYYLQIPQALHYTEFWKIKFSNIITIQIASLKQMRNLRIFRFTIKELKGLDDEGPKISHTFNLTKSTVNNKAVMSLFETDIIS